MNAPLRHPAIPAADARQERFPRLSPAQKLLQAAADRATLAAAVRGMNLKPGVVPAPVNQDRLSFNSWRAY